MGLSAIGLLGHVMAVPSVAPTLATMIGLGVGIDYALFLVTKHLDQLGEGMEVEESIANAVASSGSAIVFAGSTVVIALASLAVAGIPLVTSLGFASAIAVFMAVLASITLLPAILSLLGDWVRRVKVPAFLRPKPRKVGERRWDAWARGVARHPWVAVVASLVILVPLIVPLFSLQFGQEDVGVTPTDTTERRAYDLLTEGFGVGYNGPLLIASTLDPVAAPSAEYTKKYDRATALQKQLKREQRRLQAQADALKQRQAELEREQAQLERKASVLQQRKGAARAGRGRSARPGGPPACGGRAVGPSGGPDRGAPGRDLGTRALRPAPDRPDHRSRPAATAARPPRQARGQGGDHARAARALPLAGRAR